jgi:hypothetical protein
VTSPTLASAASTAEGSVLPTVLERSFVNGDTDAVRVSQPALAGALKLSVVPHNVTDVGVRLVESHDIRADAAGTPPSAGRSPRRPSRRASASVWNARPTHRPADDAIHWWTISLATMSPSESTPAVA